MKTSRATPAAVELRDDLLATLSTHSCAVSAEEMIATCARLTGELLIALDLGRITEDQLTNLTVGNIRGGYADAVDRSAAQVKARMI